MPAENSTSSRQSDEDRRFKQPSANATPPSSCITPAPPATASKYANLPVARRQSAPLPSPTICMIRSRSELS
ncbi:hypothetical protein K402DRAFT_394524 [Aulographum hederae CBS 113979]|uniref:Uncharacterized protein n=1 Tax=Aulographum hederae CBS 113979 TaxID=1176131 RepID=A0A6G1GXN0_9PEZI|nr:hypothetical protein K402DRAFT_394524 [Aulographum hederae CBS 113979]